MEMNNDGKELALRISGVKKRYKLGQIGGGTLQADLQSWWARKRGKEDPNIKIGEEQKARLVGQTFMALNGVDLTVYKGEALGIIGGNGAGKSTLLKLISQVTAPTEGTIEMWGRVASMLEVGTGFHSELTGRENIYMNGAILGMTKAEIDSKIEDIIEFSEVRDFIDTPVKRYSSGMYVKLAFSVAAHLDSEIMIMDEVLAVGDVAFQAKCLNKMRDAAKKEGRTVLYVSHNMNTIRQLCDRCIVLEGGKKTYDGDVEEAIKIYLSNKMDYKNIVDLEKKERETNIKNRPVTMMSLEALNCKTSIYNVGDIINMSLKCYSTRAIDSAFLMVIIKNLEGTPITMMTVNNGFKLDKDKETQIFFDIDISHLVPERYSISMVIYEVNDYGGSINLDVLKDAYLFEIVQTKNFNNNMAWIPRNWGYFYNAPLVLKN